MSSQLGASPSKPAVSAVERAHAEIRAAIIEGRYEPGVMLSESELAAALGVSRTPVRTALARLQDEGWVTIYAKRGALVRGLSADELRYSADVRQTLQILGVERAGPEDRAAVRPRLEEMLARQEQALRDGTVAARLSRLGHGLVPLPLWLRWLVLVGGVVLLSTPLSFLAV